MMPEIGKPVSVSITTKGSQEQCVDIRFQPEAEAVVSIPDVVTCKQSPRSETLRLTLQEAHDLYHMLDEIKAELALRLSEDRGKN